MPEAVGAPGRARRRASRSWSASATGVDIFTETSSLRYHAALIDAIELAPRPAPTGEQLHVSAARQGCAVPVRFEGPQRDALERVIAAVRTWDADSSGPR